ncbi:MAG: VWA domain-containing protein [Acidobacteria bacterium]|nr:VWA domain-containing protein [Acidobacteriota bacterium]
MSLSLTHTWPLFLLPGVLLLWWARRTSLIEFHPRQVDLMVGARIIAFVAAVLAMAQPVLSNAGSWLAVAYVLDVSQSIDPRAIEEGIRWVEDAVEQGDGDSTRFVAFGDNVVSAEDPDAFRTLRVSDGAVAGAVDRSATDLAGALDRAVAALPPHHVPRVVVLTDGRDNSGDLDAAVERLALDGVRFFTRPAAARGGDGAWIDSATTPASVTAGAPFEMTVRVFSRNPTPATLRVTTRDLLLLSEDVDLTGGVQDIVLLPIVDDAGVADLDVTLVLDGDPVTENNVGRASTVARPKVRVLFVEGVPDRNAYLLTALAEGGFDIVTAAPFNLPTSALGYEDFDAVILSDVDARMIDRGAMISLESWVSTFGGGLIVVGGESVFGEEGYQDTAIERTMPVWFKAEREPKDLALVIALDKSYSMVGDKMAMAKEASKAAVALLEDEQQFGLLAFDYHFYWPVPVQLARTRDRINERIASIEASSPTNIYPALEDVYLALQNTDAEVKHVILLSDGKTYEDDYETLVTQMREDEITVSAVAVGDKADRDLLGSIADWGGGRSYFISDPSRVPEIFVDETQMAQGITLEEDEPFVPAWTKTVEAFAGITREDMPELAGYVRTMPKDNAEIVMDSGADEPDPILARWQYGLGQAVFFASDAKNRWASDWLEWDGFGKLWTQLVREAARVEDFREPRFEVVREDREARVTLGLLDSRGQFRNSERPTVTVDVGGEELEISLHQIAPGTYEARTPLAAEAEAAIRWSGDDTSIERHLLPAPNAEDRYLPPDVARLQWLAETTAGAYDASVDAVLDAGDQTVVRPTRLWPLLAVIALVFYLTNMLLRRVRVIKGEVG